MDSKNLYQDVIEKQHECHKSLQLFYERNVYIKPIAFYPVNSRYANKLSINLNDTGDIVTNIITQDILKHIGLEWINFISKTNMPIFDKNKNTGFWNTISFKINTNNDIMIKIFVVHNQTFFLDKDFFDEFINYLDKKYRTNHASIYIQYSNSKSNPIKDDNMTLFYGDPGTQENILGVNFHITPNTFSQGNPFTCDMLYKLTHNFIDDFHDKNSKKSIICYGRNAGHICFTLDTKKIIYAFNPCPVVDRDLRVTMNINDIIPEINLELDEKCCKISEKISMSKDFTLIVSPGRTGLKTNLSDAINSSRSTIKDFYYISCYSKSLIRDLNRITDCTISKIQPVNLFPNTQFYESIVKITLN
ncbi:RNA methyltransferase [Cotonvirus japonicus]|uniref:RNA methyltransferase n=1 Tax=Cotonvirus japonicus TaxID=2811091 RepID=A0ABM7NSK9_9VIRU|nr:RNA methyltransferase [Cotonvirus japonicus]BCS83152.1 RNA methyltransferase [Cotonvirus japonicus]